MIQNNKPFFKHFFHFNIPRFSKNILKSGPDVVEYPQNSLGGQIADNERAKENKEDNAHHH